MAGEFIENPGSFLKWAEAHGVDPSNGITQEYRDDVWAYKIHLACSRDCRLGEYHDDLHDRYVTASETAGAQLVSRTVSNETATA